MKKAHIEVGVAVFIEKLEAIVSLVETFLGISIMDSRQSVWFPKISSAIQPIPASSLGNQGANPPDRGSVEGIPPREGGTEDTPSSVTGTSHNAGTFVASTKNSDDDAVFLTLRSLGFTNHYHVIIRNMRFKTFSRLKPMKHRLSSDWMGKLLDWETLLLPEGCIVKFG